MFLVVTIFFLFIFFIGLFILHNSFSKERRILLLNRKVERVKNQIILLEKRFLTHKITKKVYSSLVNEFEEDLEKKKFELLNLQKKTRGKK